MKSSVTPSFREYVLKKYPALGSKTEFLRFFRYLCFGDFFDEATGHLVSPVRMLAEDCCLTTWNHHFNGKAFLLDFKEKVLPDLAWSDHEAFPANCWQGKARVIESAGFDAEMMEALHRESIAPGTEQVDFVTGLPVGTSTIYAERRQETEEYDAELARSGLNATQMKIVNHLRGISAGHTFLRQIARNADKIEQAIRGLPLEVQDIQYKILANVHRNPSIYYLPSEERRTCRLSPRGDSILGLKGEVRKALCSGWVDCDLRSSQFAILAAKLAAPQSLALIDSGENLWRAFYRHTHGIDDDPPPEIKKVFKEAIYSLCFGKGTQKFVTMLNDKKLIALLSHPVIQELLTLRKKWFRQIHKEGGAKDVWGEWHAIDKTKDPKTGKTRRWAGAIAATVIQSVEMEIIAPIFDVATKHGSAQQFGIYLFQHDGSCISFQSKAKQPKAEALLKQAVEARARELGVATVLEFKPL